MASNEYHDKNMARSLTAVSNKLEDLASTGFEYGRWFGFNEACEKIMEVFMNNAGKPLTNGDAIATIVEIYQEKNK